MAGGFAGALQDFGGAVSDLFGAQGSAASASSFTEAQSIAEQNAQLTQQATAIKETQTARQIYQAVGTQKAQIGGAGMAESGTALNLLRSSVSQGALSKAMIANQGAITENAYAEQAGMFGGMASAARSAGTGQTIGGVIQAAGGLIHGYGALTSASGLGSGAVGAGSVASLLGDTSMGTLDVGGVSLGGDSVAGAAGAGIGSVAAGAGGAIAGYGLAKAAGANNTWSDVAGVVGAVASIALWIICTELHRQGRMPSRIYYGAASAFLEAPERAKRGYYLWAIPSTKHLREHPESRYSAFLERIFNIRAEYIVAKKRGMPTTWAGAAITYGLYGFCWTLGWVTPKSMTKWEQLYRA